MTTNMIDPRLQQYQPAAPPPAQGPSSAFARLPRIQAAPPAPVLLPTPTQPSAYQYYDRRASYPDPSSRLAPSTDLPVRSPPNPSIDTALGAAAQPLDDDGVDDDGTDPISPSHEGLLSDPNDPKRQRACEACRGLKVRCDQDPANPDLPCKRCQKAKRQCIITAPTRKRQKKTDNRVAELERKIEALQASIDSRDRVAASPDSQRQRGEYPSPNASIASASANAMISPVNESRRGRTPDPILSAGIKRNRSESQSDAPKKRFGHSHMLERSDSEAGRRAVSSIDGCIDELIDRQEADKIFSRYLAGMVVHLPTVAFPLDVRSADVRREKPILYLSILVAASVGMIDIYKQKTLAQLLTGVFADCIIRDGEKSLELIQALQVATVWYRPPKRYEQMNFYQLSHIAAVMAIDVGMGKKLSRGKSWRIAISSDQMRSAKHVVNPDSLEARRTWLGCYFICANTSMSLRRPNLIRWNSYMDECIEVLESSSSALPSDKLLCQHVKLQHINEEVGQQFSMDDPSATITITDSRVQYELKAFERQLAEWVKGVPRSIKNSDLQFCEHVSSLYMHEVALHMNHNIDDFRAPFTEESLKAQGAQPDVLTAAHSRALSDCLTAVHGIFKTFFTFDLDVVRALPIFYFIRVAYAVVVLIKLYFAVTAPKSEVGKIIPLEELQVDSNLEKLLEIFSTLHEQNAFRPANRFLLILTKLRDWFHNNKDSKEGSRYNPWAVAAVAAAKEVAKQSTPAPKPSKMRRASSPAKQATNSPAPVPRYDNQTPLHFLSDVATTNAEAALAPGPGPQGTSVSPTAANLPQMGGGAAWYPNAAELNAAAMNMAMPMALGWDGSAEYGMGSGFEQAMDMTLGMSDPDLSAFFMGNDGMTSFGNGFEPANAMYYNTGPPPPPGPGPGQGPGWA